MSDRILQRLENLLTEFRLEEPLTVPEWIGSLDVLSFLRAWTEFPADIGEPLFLGQPPVHRHNRWTYVWKYRRVDYSKLALLAGLNENTCRDLFIKLVAAHLIYPDGTLTAAASMTLASTNN